MKKYTVTTSEKEIIIETKDGIDAFPKSDVLSIAMNKKRKVIAFAFWAIVFIGSIVASFAFPSEMRVMSWVAAAIAFFMASLTYAGYYELSMSLSNGQVKKAYYTYFEMEQCASDYKKVKGLE
jgi:hypothetical protein